MLQLTPKNRRRLVRFRIVLAFTLAIGPAPLAAQCLDYETVTLAGTLVRQTYPGPPDYESITKGDKPVVVLVLISERPLCVVDSQSRYPRRFNEREIELALEYDQYDRYRSLLGKKVTVHGRLMNGGAKYYKQIVLAPTAIEETGVRPY
jgi:uncharacterized protein DUF4431